MEASALNHSAALPALAGRSPLLRLKSDEQLIVLVRRGQHAAFEALVQRYQSRLLAFCRHMLGSTEDAEDVLQEVFAASFNAMLADDRPINARPWLYRIARNRCLNHLRRPQHAGQDSMDVFERDGGLTTADAVHKREEFRQIVSDVQDLPETQKTALLLREIDALSYDQIAEAMETTVPSVKSLLVRARVSLAEAAEARLLTCEEVRLELGQVAEGLGKTTAPVRRHLKQCDRCRVFKGELRKANRALAAVYPLGTVVLFKKFFIAKLGLAGGGASASAGGSTAAGMGGGAGGAVFGGAAATAGASAGGALSAGMGAIASKAAAGLAAAALVTAGAVEGKHALEPTKHSNDAVAQVAAAPKVTHQTQLPAAVAKPAPPVAKPTTVAKADPVAADDSKKESRAKDEEKPADAAVVAAPAEPAAPPATTDPTTAQPAVDPVQEDGSTVVLVPGGETDSGSGSEWDEPGSSPGAGSGSTSDGSSTSNGSTSGSGSTTGSGSGSQPSAGAGSGSGSQSPPPGESSTAPGSTQPAPIAGDRGPVKRLIGRLLNKHPRR